MNRWIILGGNCVKMNYLTKQMERKLAIHVNHLDKVIQDKNYQESLMKLGKDTDWIIQSTYNRVLTLKSDDATGIVFVDYPIWRNISDLLIRFKWGKIKQIRRYQRVKRPWVIDKLEEFGVEKQIVILKSKRDMKKFIKNLN